MWVSLTQESACSKSFHFETSRKKIASLGNYTWDFYYSFPFRRSIAKQYVIITKDFNHFNDFAFETSFMENGNLFEKAGVSLFIWKHYNWKRKYFHTKYRSSHRRCSVGKVALRNFTKIHRKTSVPQSFFNKVAVWGTVTGVFLWILWNF